MHVLATSNAQTACVSSHDGLACMHLYLFQLISCDGAIWGLRIAYRLFHLFSKSMHRRKTKNGVCVLVCVFVCVRLLVRDRVCSSPRVCLCVFVIAQLVFSNPSHLCFLIASGASGFRFRTRHRLLVLSWRQKQQHI